MNLTLRRRRTEQALPPEPPPADPDLITRFLTSGGAVVELRSKQFSTRYTHAGRPFASDTPRLCNGFTWSCLGCGERDGSNSFSEPYLDTEKAKARDDANEHATLCRAMPA